KHDVNSCSSYYASAFCGNKHYKACLDDPLGIGFSVKLCHHGQAGCKVYKSLLDACRISCRAITVLHVSTPTHDLVLIVCVGTPSKDACKGGKAGKCIGQDIRHRYPKRIEPVVPQCQESTNFSRSDA